MRLENNVVIHQCRELLSKNVASRNIEKKHDENLYSPSKYETDSLTLHQPLDLFLDNPEACECLYDLSRYFQYEPNWI